MPPDAEDDIAQEYWKLVLLVACCVAMLYLTVAQFIAFIRKVAAGQFSGKRRKNCCNNCGTPNLQVLTGLTIITSSLTGLVYVSISTINHIVPFSRGLYATQIAFLMIAFGSMYLALWLRQTSFYTEPAIKHLTNKVTRWVSQFQGAFNVAGTFGFASLAVHQIYASNCDRPGCIPNWLNMVVVFIQLEVQIVLLALFVWPLLKHRKNIKTVVTDADTSALMGLVKRAVFATAASILVDVVTIGVYIASKVGVVYSGAVVLNLICTICCFANPQRKLLPCMPLEMDAKDDKGSGRTSRSNTAVFSVSGAEAVNSVDRV